MGCSPRSITVANIEGFIMAGDANERESGMNTLERLLSIIGFVLYLVAVAVILYSDDVVISLNTTIEAPTIYTMKFLGFNVLGHIALVLVLITTVIVMLRVVIKTTDYHRYLLWIACVYSVAAVIGFIYAFFYYYPLMRILEDFQHTIYMLGFFFITFHLVDSKKKWKVFMWWLILSFSIKNILIVSRIFSVDVKMFGEFALRATQSSDNMVFPLIFFPMLCYIFQRGGNVIAKLLMPIPMVLYLGHTLLGVGRTLYVIIFFCSILVFFELQKRQRIRFILEGAAVTISLVVVVLAVFPRFLEYAVGYKILSIFDWSTSGDRSNATRTLEILNISHRIIVEGAILQGLGLGAWWDDSFARLLPDGGSGFAFQSRFYIAHLWIVEQLLKLGVIGTAVYWNCIYKMIRLSRKTAHSLQHGDPDRGFLIGLFIGLIASFLMSADIVRLFLFIGIGFGMVAAYQAHILEPQEQRSW